MGENYLMNSSLYQHVVRDYGHRIRNGSEIIVPNGTRVGFIDLCRANQRKFFCTASLMQFSNPLRICWLADLGRTLVNRFQTLTTVNRPENQLFVSISTTRAENTSKFRLKIAIRKRINGDGRWLMVELQRSTDYRSKLGYRTNPTDRVLFSLISMLI